MASSRLRLSPAWTAADQAGLDTWMRDYLTWLLESPHGQAEAKNGNNHETWYDVQVAALAMFTRQPAIARRTLEGARQRIARQIEPDGRQPRELSRTRAWHYSAYNLTAFFNLATLGDARGRRLVDLSIGGRAQPPEGARFSRPVRGGRAPLAVSGAHRLRARRDPSSPAPSRGCVGRTKLPRLGRQGRRRQSALGSDRSLTPRFVSNLTGAGPHPAPRARATTAARGVNSCSSPCPPFPIANVRSA